MSNITSKFPHTRHTCNRSFTYTTCAYVSDLLHTKCHMPTSSVSLITALNTKRKEKFRAAAILSLYTLQKCYLHEVAYLCKIY
jgi:hypothetical protein